MGKLTPERRKVLEWIEYYTNFGYGCRVPDEWINEANASVDDGQTTDGKNGRRLTPKGAAALKEAVNG